MPGPIVVPLDGSSFAEVALPMGRLLSQTTGAELHLVHVMTPPLAPAFHPEEQLKLDRHVRDRSQQYLAAQARAADGGAAAHTAVLAGDHGVAEALTGYAAEQGASWIVQTTHGAGGLSRWMWGSVAADVARLAPCGVLFLRPWDVTGTLTPEQSRFNRILLPLDGSEEAEAAIGPAIDFAKSVGAALDLVRVVPPHPQMGLHGLSLLHGSAEIDDEAAAYLLERVKEVRLAGIDAEPIRVVNEEPAEGILFAARELGSDAVVMSTHGRGGMERAVLGSVADRVLQKVTLPLALVRTRVPAAATDEGAP